MAPAGESAYREGTRALAAGAFAERLGSLRELGPALAGGVLPFALVLYLALKGGGYDAVVRSEVGIAVWWVVLLGALAGVLPSGRVGAPAWAGLGLLAAFAAWTATGIGWSESSERSVEELGRVAMLAGVFALGLAIQGWAGLRRTLGGVAAAIALVGALALLSRLQPSWFPANDVAHFLPGARARLSYPVHYWNGLATLMAIGIPLLAAIAAQSRRLATQALATAALPVLALTAFFTLSRGGAAEIGIALAVLVALHPRRLALLPTLSLGVAGSALVVAAATQRDALEDGFTGVAAQQQGDEMLAFVLVVCAGVALIRVAFGLAARHGIGPRVSVSRPVAGAATAVVAVVAVVAALAAGVPSELSDRWETFKDPTASVGSGVERFESLNGSGRYQLWESAVDANATDPWIGIGPGTYEYWWASEATRPGFVRDAHSLYLEALAELGIVGFALVVGLVGLVLVGGTVRALRAEPGRRAYLAGGVAACAAFAAAAAVDWVWELTVVAVAFLLVAAAVLAGGRRERAEPGGEARPAAGRGGLAARVALASLAVLALGAIALPLAGLSEVRESQARAQGAELPAALDAALTAADIQPYAATPALQRALVLELDGNLKGAAAAAGEATRKEATNWRTWLTLSRIEAKRGRAEAAVAAYRQARELNPLWPPFATARPAPVGTE